MVTPGFNFTGMTDEEIRSAVMSGAGNNNYKEPKGYMETPKGGFQNVISRTTRREDYIDFTQKKPVKRTKKQKGAILKRAEVKTYGRTEEPEGYMQVPTGGFNQTIGVMSEGYIDYSRKPGVERPTTAQQRRVERRKKEFKDGMYDENQKKISRLRFEEETRGMERQQKRDFFGVSGRQRELRERKFAQEMTGKEQQEKIDFIKTNKAAQTIQERAFKEQLKGLTEQQKTELWQSSALYKRAQAIGKGTEKAIGSAASFAGTASLGQDFTPEQETMRQLFGGGEKFWGINQQPVIINNALNPGMQDPYNETADIFGFGQGSERSGLF